MEILLNLCDGKQFYLDFFLDYIAQIIHQPTTKKLGMIVAFHSSVQGVGKNGFFLFYKFLYFYSAKKKKNHSGPEYHRSDDWF